MCDSSTQGAIEKVVADLVSNNIMFTALDVTKKVWVELGNDAATRWPQGYHGSIKNDIHKTMFAYLQQGVYERQLVDIGQPVMVFVYYATGGDPNGYQATTTANPPTVSTTTVYVPPAHQDTGDASNGYARGITQYDRPKS